MTTTEAKEYLTTEDIARALGLPLLPRCPYFIQHILQKDRDKVVFMNRKYFADKRR